MPAISVLVAQITIPILLAILTPTPISRLILCRSQCKESRVDLMRVGGGRLVGLVMGLNKLIKMTQWSGY